MKSCRIIAPAVAILAIAAPAAELAPNAQAVTLPASSQLATALQTILSPSAATSITNDVTRIASSPSTANIGTLDQALNAVLTDVSSVAVPAKTAAAGASLETALTALDGLLPASPTAAQRQAVNELSTAVTDAGLSSLLSGLGSASTSAVTELTSLQSLLPGESTDNTSTAAIGSVVSALATDTETDADGGAGTTLSSIAATFDSGVFLTPAQLQGVISSLASVSSTDPAGSSGATVTQVATALATVLSQSGSLAGALANAGSSLSAITDPTDLTTALSEISSLPGSTPGAELQLPGLADIFNAIAATPGVSTDAAGELDSVAASISSEVTPTALLSDLTELTEAPLTAPLQTLLNQISSDLADSGAVLGTIQGMASSAQAEALSELESLGQGTQTGTLPGLAEVLTAVKTSDPDVGPALTDLETILAADSLDSAQLSGAAAVIAYAAQTQGGPEAATLTALAQVLSHDASTMTQTATPTVTAPAAPSLTSVPVVSSVSLLRAHRAGNDVALTLACPAGGGSCSATIVGVEAWARKVTRRVTVAAGARTTIVVAMKPEPPRHIIRPTIRLVITSAAHQIIRALG